MRDVTLSLNVSDAYASFDPHSPPAATICRAATMPDTANAPGARVATLDRALHAADISHGRGCVLRARRATKIGVARMAMMVTDTVAHARLAREGDAMAMRSILTVIAMNKATKMTITANRSQSVVSLQT